MSEKNIVSRAEALAKKVCAESGVSFWDVEYKKEGNSYVLRLFIDKEGGVTTDDCERVSRTMDPMLDEEDFIDKSYCFEVSSPGIDRRLSRPEHFQASLGQNVDIKLFSPIKGAKLLQEAKLLGATEGAILVEYEKEQMKISLSDTATVRISFSF